jgi:hypothetical protein
MHLPIHERYANFILCHVAVNVADGARSDQSATQQLGEAKPDGQAY